MWNVFQESQFFLIFLQPVYVVQFATEQGLIIFNVYKFLQQTSVFIIDMATLHVSFKLGLTHFEGDSK